MEERKTIEDLKTESPEQYEAMMRNKRFEELGWYVLYVTALHERQFLEAFTGNPDPYKRGGKSGRRAFPPLDPPIEAYVPIREEKRKWSDRVKIVPVILTPGIIFVHIKLSERRRLYINDHVNRFLYNKDKQEPARISDAQMEQFRNMVEEGEDVSMITPIVGDTVQVLRGKFQGYVGEIVRVDGKNKFQLRLNEVIAITVSINADDVKYVPKGTQRVIPDERFV